MQFLEEEILEITEATWSAMLGLDIQPSPICTASEHANSSIVGHVGISGAWNGQVILYGSDEMARTAASTVFAIAPEEVQEQDQIDAIYELSNIIAGNIKSLLPEPCQLSLPAVQRSTHFLFECEGHDRVSELAFECNGQPLVVTIWKQKENN